MPPVSDEQIRRAKEVGILAYLRTHEPESLRKSRGAGDEYYLAEHDSLKISNGKFHWFSRGIGGASALDYLMKVRGMGFIDAVEHLTGEWAAYRACPPPALPKQVKPFILPPKNINNDRVYAYLRGRGIDGDLIGRCFKSGALYENAQGNCVFVGFDGTTPRFATERGTRGRFLKDVPGSNKAFGFMLPPKNPGSRNLACFESPADALSHAGIHKLDGDKWDGYRLSLGGIGSSALVSFLERHPQVDNVRLCLDCDSPGLEAANRIARELLADKRFSQIRIALSPPPDGFGKDYNDCLQTIIRLHQRRTRPGRSQEAADLR